MKVMEGALAGSIVACVLGFPFGGFVAAVTFLFVLMIYVVLSQSEVLNIAKTKRQQFLYRLPNSVDLIAMMLGAGSSFWEALSKVVQENKGHPIGEILGQVETELALNRSRVDALTSLREKVDEPLVDELVTSIIEGERLGTVQSEALASMAERMRLKKTQWIEKAATEAQVKMAFPGLLIMIACALVILGPFVLQAVFQFLGES